jgi:hypothetical protein
VTGVDPSPWLLGMAARAVEAETEEVRDRVTLREGDIDRLEAVGGGFDLICCHGGHVPAVSGGVARQALRPGLSRRLVSVLPKNRANLALRAAMLRDGQGALDSVEDRYYTNRLGIDRARSDRPHEVIGALAAAIVAALGMGSDGHRTSGNRLIWSASVAVTASGLVRAKAVPIGQSGVRE